MGPQCMAPFAYVVTALSGPSLAEKLAEGQRVCCRAFIGGPGGCLDFTMSQPANHPCVEKP
jgi:hypothetical protein